MPDSGPTILLVGLGHLGGVLLELLARESWIGRVVACSRHRARGEARTNLARLSANAQGFEPWIEYQETDLEDTDRFARLIQKVSPDLILSTATRQTWWLPDLLPEEPRRTLQAARFGPWLPIHLSLTRRFMEGIRASAFAGPVLTAPFPDVVNCILGKIGLAPTCGIGNIDEIVAKVRRLATDRLRAAAHSIEIIMVAHHALESFAFGGDRGNAPPYFLRVLHEDRDVTEMIQARDLLFAPYPIGHGPSTAFFTAGSTVRLIQALFRDDPTLLHAPSPKGLPGGYPVLVSGGHLEPAPIDGLELDQAIAINEQSQPFDGIQEIEPDGTVVFMPESVAIMKAELGYDCARLPPDASAERSRELSERFAAYARRHGVDLSRFH